MLDKEEKETDQNNKENIKKTGKTEQIENEKSNKNNIGNILNKILIVILIICIVVVIGLILFVKFKPELAKKYIKQIGKQDILETEETDKKNEHNKQTEALEEQLESEKNKKEYGNNKIYPLVSNPLKKDVAYSNDINAYYVNNEILIKGSTSFDLTNIKEFLKTHGAEIVSGDEENNIYKIRFNRILGEKYLMEYIAILKKNKNIDEAIMNILTKKEFDALN